MGLKYRLAKHKGKCVSKIMQAVTVALVVSSVSISSFASANTTLTQQQLIHLVKKLSQQTKNLSRQVTSLKHQVSYLEAHQAVPHHMTSHRRRLKKSVNVNKHHANALEPFYPRGFAITTAPYLGVQTRFNGSNLLVNVSSLGEDVRLLQYRYRGLNALRDIHEAPPSHPFLKFSGKVEGQMIAQRANDGHYHSDINLSTFELDIMAAMDKWVTGFIALDYDDSPVNNGRVNNSRLFVEKGFITIGNLEKTHFFFTIGQGYFPFGQYSSALISTPLTMALARVKMRGAEIGYTHPGDYGLTADLFAFRADNLNYFTNNRVAEGGINLSYAFPIKQMDNSIGLSYITNMAESGGMESTGLNSFTGFSNNSAVMFMHRVPGIDVRLNSALGKVSFIAEYVAATKRFDPRNLTYNGRGARPTALHVEAGYNFKVFNKPTNLAVGYGVTSDAMALNIPQRRYFAVLNTSWYRDTLEALEFRHDVLYHGADSASGDGITVSSQGHFLNAMIAQLGIYF